jgi:hypothetical protein
MSRLGAWFRGSTPLKSSAKSSPAGSQIDLIAAEVAVLEDAMVSAGKIMNDDIEGAEEGLKKGSSAFHSLGMGITTFMRSILGFEKDIMTEAANRLMASETLALAEQRKAEHHGGSSKVYPPGAEFQLVQAEAQLMGAVLAVLHESLTEGIRGFYKLRKAFITLDGIMQAEANYLKQQGLQPDGTSTHAVSAPSEVPTSNGVEEKADDDDMEFVDAEEGLSGEQTPAQYQGHLSKGAAGSEQKLGELSLDETGNKQRPLQTVSSRDQLDLGPESEIFSNTIDVFIHSGANMCFGVLMLIISMVPPAFSRLLSIIGFKGDREKGIKMLWQSTRFDNINGAVAGLMLLGYYNGLLGFADILPSDEDTEKGAVVGYPKTRCDKLLSDMTSRYPESRLWRLEAARAKSNRRDIPGAIEMLNQNTDSKMRQTQALNNFELSLNSMFVQDYVKMRDNFLRCVELNDWSHALYYYIAGCAELELYRDAFHGEKRDDAKIQQHKKRAEELFRKAPTVAGKKRFMSRPMPFEQYLTRKVQKWEERAEHLGLELADAVGVSPAQEMVYLWNGTKKMQRAEMEKAELTLDWGRLTAPKEQIARIRAEHDEAAIAQLCCAVIKRALGYLEEAKVLLQDILDTDK